MPPVAQSVFAEALGISEHFTAGSHEGLPYSDFPTFPKQSAKHQFVTRIRSSVFKGYRHCSLSAPQSGGIENGRPNVL